MKNFILAVLMLTLTSCGVQWHLSTTNHDPIYGPTLVVADDVKVDTLNYTQFKRKLRTDFSFRWDYANYMATQPLSFYWRNWNVGPRYLGNVHDFWFNSHQYWIDWAFDYPFNSYYWDRWWRPNRWNWGYGGWYSNTWNNHWYQYGYSGWYGHDSMLWGSQWRRNNVGVAYISGRRGSRFADGNSNIQINLDNRRNNNNNNSSRSVRSYNNPNNVGIIIRNGDDVRVIKPRVYTNPNDVINNNNIRINPNNNSNNNIRVNPSNNSRGINSNNVRGSWRPNNNSNNNSIRSSSPPVINRGSSNISRGSSSSGGSSRGGRGKN